jgi:hypothetical protein
VAVAVLLVGVVVTTPAQAAQQNDESSWTVSVTESVLLRNEPGGIRGSAVVSADAKHAAYATATVAGKQVVHHMTRGPLYDDVGAIEFSPDGLRSAYAAEMGGHWFMVIDGNVEGPYDNVLPAVFSPDSTRVAYKAGRNGRFVVVVDGIEGKSYYQLTDTDLVFSPDTKRIAYLAAERESFLGVLQRGAFFLVLDGSEKTRYLRIGLTDPKFSPDSQHLAYWAGTDNDACVVLDGVELPPYGSRARAYSGIGNASLVFSPDSGRLA